MSTVGGPRLSTIPTFQNTYSMDFDGVDDYVNLGRITAMEGATNFSFSMWIYPTSYIGLRLLFGKFASATDFFYAYTSNSFGYIFWHIADGQTNYPRVSTTSRIDLNTWGLLTFVYDGSLVGNLNKAKIYMNGTLALTTTTAFQIPSSISLDTTDFYLAQRNGALSTPTSGKIDEVSAYDYSLSPSEVMDIYNLGTPTDLSLLPTPPVNWYRMGDNGAYKSPQWLLPNNENKDKVSNYSFEFDGVDDYIELGSIPHLQNTTEYSVSSWFKSPLNNLYQVIWGWFDGADGYLQLLLISDGSFVVYNYRTSTAYGLSATGLVSADTWYNTLVVFDGGGATNADRLKLYINGNPITLTYTGTIPTQTGTMLINTMWLGASNSPNFWGLEGNIDEVSIFNSAISIGDVWDGSGEPTDISAVSGLANYYKMGEDATFSGGVWTVPDSVGSNDGTSNAMTIEDRVGDAPNSSNNALSYNMDEVDRVEDTP